MLAQASANTAPRQVGHADSAERAPTRAGGPAAFARQLGGEPRGGCVSRGGGEGHTTSPGLSGPIQ